MPRGFCFPKSARLLKRAEYRKIYQEGSRFVSPLFAAFYRRTDADNPARVGFTTPKALGKAVVRNRIRRRLREAVRLQLPSLAPGWELVFNPRRATLDAPIDKVRAEVTRLFTTLQAKS